MSSNGNGFEVKATGSLATWFRELRPLLIVFGLGGAFAGGLSVERFTGESQKSRSAPPNGTAYHVEDQAAREQLSQINTKLAALPDLVREMKALRRDLTDIQEIVWPELGSKARPRRIGG